MVNDVCVAYMVSQILPCSTNLLPNNFLLIVRVCKFVSYFSIFS